MLRILISLFGVPWKVSCGKENASGKFPQEMTQFQEAIASQKVFPPDVGKILPLFTTNCADCIFRFLNSFQYICDIRV